MDGEGDQALSGGPPAAWEEGHAELKSPLRQSKNVSHRETCLPRTEGSRYDVETQRPV